MKEQPYHKFVFDTTKKKFIGDFEAMYKAEDRLNFDSWYQENLNHLTKRISLEILSAYNFTSIIDFGCGKGFFTNALKKKNNTVVGIDISPTAIAKAKGRFPDIDFLVADSKYFNKRINKVELIVMMEALSYIENWKDLIAKASVKTKYLLITLYLPPNPIGYIKDFESLISQIKIYFDIETKLLIDDNCIILLNKSKK